jgi:hypothetical protein
MGEFSEEHTRCYVVSFGSQPGGVEGADLGPNSVGTYLRHEAFTHLINTFVPALAVGVWFTIGHILRPCAGSEVVALAVEAVAVFVINEQPGWLTHYEAVQKDPPTSDAGHGVLVVAFDGQRPPMGGYPVKIFGIDLHGEG